MNVAHRSATRASSERQFMITTWASSYKKSFAAGIITSEDWPAVMHQQLGKILDRAGARAIIAYEKSDADYFYGWIAGDTTDAVPIVYYVYVKEPYRRSGIARGLFSALGVEPGAYFVHVCETPKSIELASKIPRARFNPLEVRYPKENRRRPL